MTTTNATGLPKAGAQPLTGAPATRPPVEGTSVWSRAGRYAIAVSPTWLSKLFEYGLGRVAVWMVAAFVLVLLLPHLSLLAVRLVTWVLPASAGAAVHDAYVSAIHKGYDIDKVREQLKVEASTDALEKLKVNNESLDYVQYVEFYLTRADQPKEIPALLKLGQRAKITVRRSQVIRLTENAEPGCMVTEVGTSEPVLDVQLDGLKITSLAAMVSPGKMGEIALSKSWWDENLKRARSEATTADGIAAVRFGKTPAFEQRMTPCTALKVEATVEVYKRDMGTGS